MNYGHGIAGAAIGAAKAYSRDEEAKIQAHRAYVEQADCATTAYDPNTIPNVFSMLGGNLDRARMLLGRLRNANDFINGTRPTPGEASNGKVSPSPNGAVETMNEGLRQIACTLDEIDVEVRRLERVVG